MKTFVDPSAKIRKLEPDSATGRVKRVLAGEILVAVSGPGRAAGIPFLLADGGRTAIGALKGAMDHACAQLGCQPAELEAKIAGPSHGADEAERALQAIGVRVKGVARRGQAPFEIHYEPQSGRLQVEKQDDAPAAIPAASNAPRAASQSAAPDFSTRKIKVLIVDDSATVRKILRSILEQDAQIEVVGAVELPSQVEPMIKKHSPDVLTLDIHMPEMNGVELFQKLYPRFGIPSIMITSVSKDEGPLVMQALEAGAFDYIQKPSLEEIRSVGAVIIEKVKAAASSRRRTTARKAAPVRQLDPGTAMDTNSVVCIGSSTGGTEALREILTQLPAGIPPIVVVQHIPAHFSEAIAKRLNTLCRFEVREAVDGDEVRPGLVLIAPGGMQMSLKQKGSRLEVKITDDPPVNRHKPSVDVLFESAAQVLGKRAVGVILTGMGADGAKGMLQMKQAGARTVAQDEATCVVFGMPREAIRLGGALQVSPLGEIPDVLMQWLPARKLGAAG